MILAKRWVDPVLTSSDGGEHGCPCCQHHLPAIEPPATVPIRMYVLPEQELAGDYSPPCRGVKVPTCLRRGYFTLAGAMHRIDWRSVDTAGSIPLVTADLPGTP